MNFNLFICLKHWFMTFFCFPKPGLKLNSQTQKSGIINANPHLPETIIPTTRFNVDLKKNERIGKSAYYLLALSTPGKFLSIFKLLF